MIIIIINNMKITINNRHNNDNGNKNPIYQQWGAIQELKKGDISKTLGT